MPIVNPDWTPPIEMTFDEGKPIRSEQGLMLAGNPIAIAQGAVGAPRVNGLALGGVHLGRLFRKNTTVPIGINDIGDFETIALVGVMSSTRIDISFSTDNGVTFGAWQRIAVGPSIHGTFIISKSAGSSEFNGIIVATEGSIPFITDMPVDDTRSLTIPAAANAFRLRANQSLGSNHFSLVAYLLGGTQ